MIVSKSDDKDDPKEIAHYLIQEHGVDQAIIIAMDNIAKTSGADDYYSLSIWREVRVMLRKKQENSHL